MKSALKYVLGCVLLLGLAAAYLWFFEQSSHSAPKAPPAPIEATGNPIADGIRKAAEYLKIHQEEDGNFSKGIVDPKPAITALVVDSLARSPDHYTDVKHPFVKKAVDAIVARQHDDGSICTSGFGLDNYCTSASILALTALENPAYATVIQKAKDYLIAIQNKDDEEDPNFGGTGYGAKSKPDGSNASQWVEALRAAGVKPGDKAFKNAEKFFERLQNNPETNKKPVEGTVLDNDGGSFYRPGESKMSVTTKDGKKMLKSYGMMSYASLKSFMYMDIAKNDPRVGAAYKWVRNNFTVDENRNIGENSQDGIFYYYLTMAKALALYGDPIIESPDGTKHNWAKELSDKLLMMQDKDGSWKNTRSKKWKEDDSVYVTAFAIRTLSLCHSELEKQKSQKAEGSEKKAENKANAPGDKKP